MFDELDRGSEREGDGEKERDRDKDSADRDRDSADIKLPSIQLLSH